jgi:putative transposase
MRVNCAAAPPARGPAAYLRPMARTARSLLPDGVFHVTARGVARRPIYLDDEDRRLFAGLLGYIVEDHAWRVLATCLMGNHFHLVVDAEREQLSRGMHRLGGRYADAFNARYARAGHLFGDRFGARVVGDDEHLATVCGYVVDNPVRAGLCERAADWPWSRLTLDAGVGVSPFSGRVLGSDRKRDAPTP